MPSEEDLPDPTYLLVKGLAPEIDELHLRRVGMDMGDGYASGPVHVWCVCVFCRFLGLQHAYDASSGVVKRS